MGKLVKTVYGDALFEYANENDCIKQWREEIAFVKKCFKEHADFCAMLSHPRIQKGEKVHLLETTFEKQISTALLGFLVLIVEKNHFGQLFDIFVHFEKRYKKFYNIGMATVTSAKELSLEQKRRIEKRLLETTGYDTIEVDWQVDTALLGGIIISMDGRLVDGSVQSKLYALTKELKKAVISGQEV